MTEVSRYDPCGLIITTSYLVVTQKFEIKRSCIPHSPDNGNYKHAGHRSSTSLEEY